ncbi:MAG: hypothetical protein H7333_03410 [Bdellovibrionales bacterium]|nr:hypothetical protein [Oligoflexia bacterium]
MIQGEADGLLKWLELMFPTGVKPIQKILNLGSENAMRCKGEGMAVLVFDAYYKLIHGHWIALRVNLDEFLTHLGSGITRGLKQLSAAVIEALI